MYSHIHIGTGALGLGLIIPAFDSNGIKSTLVNRRSENSFATNQHLKKNRCYSISYEGQDREIRFTNFLFFDELKNENLQFHDVAGIILTFSVKDGVHSQEFLSALRSILVIICDQEKPTYLIGCENDGISREVLKNILRESEQNTISKLQKFVTPLESVVDRMCRYPQLSDTVKVRVENYENWEIEHDGNLVDLLTKEPITFVAKIDISKRKKLILYNLLHALIGIWALEENNDFLNDYLNSGREQLNVLHELQKEVAQIFLSEYPDFDKSDIIEYSTRIATRMRSFPDGLPRILSRFSGKFMINEFLKNLRYKGLSLLDNASEQEILNFPYISLTLIKLTKLIATDQYALEGDDEAIFK